MKRWLFLFHRWLGLFGCVLILLWFASGFVMMYVPYPELTPQERFSHARSVDLSRVKLSRVEALEAVKHTTDVKNIQRLRLVQPADRPVYAIGLGGGVGSGGWAGIDAIDGRPVVIDEQAATASAKQFHAEASVLGLSQIDYDQWSVSSSLDPHRPLWAVSMSDGMRLYVSGRTGEVVRDAALYERAWNWVGSVVHWIYPAALRRHATAWHWTVVVLSCYALLTALLGTVIGSLRWRRYASGRMSPYRGWMRWHHVLGLSGAIFILAWLLSGLLSMNPGQVFSNNGLSEHDRAIWRGAPLPVVANAVNRTVGTKDSPGMAHVMGAVEIEWLAGEDGVLAVARDVKGDSVVRLDSATSAIQIDQAMIARRTARFTQTPVVDIQRLTAYDSYYYARYGDRPLPVWRVRLEDDAGTWLHVDGATGELLSRLDRSNRAQRWLYHGLHSWDLPFLLEHRPLWDLAMLAALCLGTLFSLTSVAIAWRRLKTMQRVRPGNRAIAKPKSDVRSRRLTSPIPSSEPSHASGHPSQ